MNTNSDIFLVDEVLAVGDKPFKKKCMAKMQEIRASGRTLFYVSHAAGSVRKMCDRVIVLEKGRKVFDGETDAGIKFLHYEDTEDDVNSEQEEDEELGSATCRRLAGRSGHGSQGLPSRPPASRRPDLPSGPRRLGPPARPTTVGAATSGSRTQVLAIRVGPTLRPKLRRGTVARSSGPFVAQCRKLLVGKGNHLLGTRRRITSL